MGETKPGAEDKQANMPLTSTSITKPSATSDGKDENAKGEKPPVTDGKKPKNPPKPVAETGGPEGPEPTRYGDWERKGRCVDF